MNQATATLPPSAPVAAGTRLLDVTALFVPLRPLRRIGREPAIIVRCDGDTYDPKPDPLYDWVYRVAIPGFRALASRRQVRRFCTVGTGTGCDALAAFEIFALEQAALTDLSVTTVDQAALSVLDNLAPGQTLDLVTGVGDLLEPFVGSGRQFDLIYENLPNIALLNEEQRFLRGRDCATYHRHRAEQIPPLVRENLLELHWLCLHQAHGLLSPGGTLLSSIGARRPIAEICRAMTVAGTEQRVEILTWKLQSEPEAVIGGFAAREHPQRLFSYYPAELLERMLDSTTPEENAACAFEVEAALEPHRITAGEALARSRRGEPIGHTVVLLASEPQ